MKTKKLKESYESACNDYLKEFCNRHEFDFDNAYWVAEDVGGVAVINDYYFVNMQEIIHDLEIEATEELKSERTFPKWFDYCVRCKSISNEIITPNLKAWKMGCPIHSEGKMREFEHGRARIAIIKQQLKNSIDEANKF